MAAVLKFELRDKAGRSSPQLSGPAEIIIFTGVRFERLEDDAVQMQPGDGTPPGKGSMQRRA